VTSTVNQFHRDATSQIESIHGESHEGLGAELFKALSGVMMVCFPEEYIIEKMAAEVIKGARDAALASIGQSEAASAQGRLDQAKDELRRKLDDLAAATEEAMRAAWHAGVANLPTSLDAVFTEPTSDVHEFLRVIGADVPYWDRRLRMYHAAYGSDIVDFNGMQIIQAAMLTSED
jgi:hypothetical protein